MYAVAMPRTRGYKWREFGERVRGARKARGLTREDLAQRLDVDPQTIWNWESGYSRPRQDRLVQLAEALGTTASDLLAEKRDGIAETRSPYGVEPPPTPEELRIAMNVIRLIRQQVQHEREERERE